MNGSLISIQENFKNWEGGEQTFLLATRNFCWLPTFFKFLEPWSYASLIILIKICQYKLAPNFFVWLQDLGEICQSLVYKF